MYKEPAAGQFDVAHLQSIHRYIFQDVYEWAGQFRTVNIARSGQFYSAFPQQIVPSLERLLGDLSREKQIFTSRAAFYMGELNAIHPFRDGNGRRQREFIRQLALRSGYSLDWSRVTREQMYEASHRSFKAGDHGGLERVLEAALRKD